MKNQIMVEHGGAILSGAESIGTAPFAAGVHRSGRWVNVPAMGLARCVAEFTAAKEGRKEFTAPGSQRSLVKTWTHLSDMYGYKAHKHRLLLGRGKHQWTMYIY